MRCDGFVPGSLVRIYWQGISRSQTSFVAGAGGSGEATFSAPPVAPGRWYARASDGLGRAATVRLTVPAPVLTTDPILGQRGAAMTVALAGFRSGERVALRWFGLTGSSYSTLRTPTVAADGSAQVALTVPGASAAGRHRFAAVGLTSGTVVERIFTVVTAAQPLNFYQGAPGCNRIAFIFNVGIGNPADAGVLATLKRENVPATMFVMGWWVDRFPDSFRQIASGGFVIGSHGYDPINLPTTGDAAVRADIRAADAAIGTALGRTPDRWFTPFAASIDDRVRRIVVEEGYVPVGWRITSNDWSASATEADVFNRVVNGAYDGAIVEFHLDGPATATSTGRALPRIIQTLRARGYRFVTVPQLAAPCGTASASGKTPAAPANLASLPREAVLRSRGTPLARRRSRPPAPARTPGGRVAGRGRPGHRGSRCR